jgi:hypothetical protein
MAMAGDDDRDDGAGETPQPDPGTGPDDGDTGDDGHDLQAQLAHWKRQARENEKRAKENAEAAKRLRELEESEKSETQRLQEQLAEAQRERERLQRETMVARVALRKGLTDAQAKRLQGDTEEDLEADADELLSLMRPVQEQEPATDLRRRPRETYRSGSTPGAEPDETDPRKLVEGLRSY